MILCYSYQKLQMLNIAMYAYHSNNFNEIGLLKIVYFYKPIKEQMF